MDITLANPRGFCAGVDRAIDIVNRALDIFEPPIYVRHEVVHNKFVVDNLRNRGAVFVDELHEVPDDSIVIFSAHGVSKAVQHEAKDRGLKVFDATCPLVTKVHMEVARYSIKGSEMILIGHKGHPEVEGTMGQYDSATGGEIYLVEDVADVESLNPFNPDELSYVSQTTLSMDDTAIVIEALREKFPKIQGPKTDDICYATQNRQDAVKDLAKQCDLILVVGSPNSSNSNRLRELGERMGSAAYLIDNADEIKADWFTDDKTVGITAGASAPEVLVQQVVDRVKELGGTTPVELSGREENITFNLPKELRLKSVD
jgi:4-hydroxy-3-methylbut-2-enyl diphosphate reductase